MTEKTKKIVKWSGIGAVALGTVAIIVSGNGAEVAYKVIEVVESVFHALGTGI